MKSTFEHTEMAHIQAPGTFTLRYHLYIADTNLLKYLVFPVFTRVCSMFRFQPTGEVLEKHVKWGDGFIFLYSLTDKASLTYLEEVKDVLEKVKGRECPLALVGNKSDLIEAREIGEDMCANYGQKFDCPKFEISVAEGSQGVLEVMEEILCQIKRDFIKNLTTGNVSQTTDNKPRSKLYSMKKAFKKRINRSHSDTF